MNQTVPCRLHRPGRRRRGHRLRRGARRRAERSGQGDLRARPVARIAGAEPPQLDTFGHGTFTAGIIAGHDGALTAPYAAAPASAYRGIAPDARIVSVEVATADGGTDVTQVIAAINWVVQHRNDNGMNIRVLSLSYGTNSTQAYTVDPLAYAVEQAWKEGIVVVVSAGARASSSSSRRETPASRRRRRAR